ncbi:hypothetical protein [Streptomyces albidoflavus]|nr:hypothetical protein [Streptomyces albidoflavus]
MAPLPHRPDAPPHRHACPEPHPAGVAVAPPDLDDVFLALPGEGAKETTR